MREIPCPLREEELRRLYVEEKLTDEEIAARVPDATVKRVRAWRHRMGIETLPRWSRNVVAPIEGQLQSLLVGSMLGDGRLAFRGTVSQFMETHCGEQKPYLEWKAAQWGAWVTSEPPLKYTPKREGDREFSAWRMTTVSHAALNPWQELFYPSRERGWKRLLPQVVDLVDALALTVWYLDDGYAGWWPGITFGMDPASRSVAESIFEKFGLNPRWAVKKGETGEFSMDGEDTAHRFLDIIRPHVPECMLRKVTGFGFQGPHYQVRHKLSGVDERVASGMSAREVGATLGVGATTVARYMEKNGLTSTCEPSGFTRGEQNKSYYAARYPGHVHDGNGFVTPEGKRVAVHTAKLSNRSDSVHNRRWGFGLRGTNPGESQGCAEHSCLCLDSDGKVLVHEFRFPAAVLEGRRELNIGERVEDSQWEPYLVRGELE